MAKATGAEKAGGKPKFAALALLALASLAAVAAGWFGAGVLTPATTPATSNAAPPVTEAAGHAAPAASAHGEAGHGEGEGESAVETPIGMVVDLPAIVVNLAAPSKVWVRAELAVVFSETPETETLRQLHQDILAFLATVNLAQLAGASGLHHLREDILDIARIRTDGKSRSVLFRTLVFE